MPEDSIVVQSSSPQETRRLGRTIGEMLLGGEVVSLHGSLGAGKTVFVQGLALGLGILGPVQSPSFVLERIHQGRLVLRHLDLYRLTGEEAWEAGLLLEPDHDTVMVVEWAERASQCLDPTLTVKMEFSPTGADDRRILFSSPSEEWREKVRDAVFGLGH